MTSRRFLVLPLVVAAMASTGCAPGESDQVPPSITCHTQYRPDAESLAGSTDPSLTVERADELVPGPDRIEFDTLTLEVTFHGDAPEGHNVTMVVATTDGEPVVRNLYQFTDGTELSTEFAGGHGFTGLEYVFHEGSSLQVWCQSDDR